VNQPCIAQGVLIEKIGEELVVVIPGSHEALRVTGQEALALSEIKSGHVVNADSPAVLKLAELGVIDVPGLSRRGLIKAGAIGAGAGIAVLAMPSVAAASSEPNVAALTITGFFYPIRNPGFFEWAIEVDNTSGVPLPLPNTTGVGITDLEISGFPPTRFKRLNYANDTDWIIRFESDPEATEITKPSPPFTGFFTWGSQDFEVSFT